MMKTKAPYKPIILAFRGTEEQRAQLRRDAAAAGQTMQDYVMAKLQLGEPNGRTYRRKR